jgi:hypothetical protein
LEPTSWVRILLAVAIGLLAYCVVFRRASEKAKDLKKKAQLATLLALLGGVMLALRFTRLFLI